jgi:prevent-host-death family protein
MIRVNMHEAKSQLSKLVDAVLNGEEVVICRAGEPVVELRSVTAKATKREFGRYKGLFSIDERFFGPMTDEEIGWPSGFSESDRAKKSRKR